MTNIDNKEHVKAELRRLTLDLPLLHSILQDPRKRNTHSPVANRIGYSLGNSSAVNYGAFQAAEEYFQHIKSKYYLPTDDKEIRDDLKKIGDELKSIRLTVDPELYGIEKKIITSSLIIFFVAGIFFNT